MKFRSLFLLVLALSCSSIYSVGQWPADASASGMPHQPLSNSHDHDNGTVVINGVVQDIQSAPMRDVRVELTDSNGRAVTAAYTNSSGSFEFPRISPGTYTIVATAGLVQTSAQVDANTWSGNLVLHLPTDSKNAQDGVQGNSISVAQMRIPDKARDELRKAQADMSKDKTDEATRHLEKALSIAPNYAEALTMRAVLALDQKNTEAAAADLEKAIKADPNSAMAYVVMGSLLNRQSKFDDAIRSLQRGESLAPNSWQTHFELGKAYIGKEDYQEALTQLQRAQSMAPSPYSLIYLLQAHAHLAMKQYSEAMSSLEAYLQKEPKGPNSDEARKMLQETQAFLAKEK